MNSKRFGTLNGQDVTLYTLNNGILSCDVTDYGATITSLRVRDRNNAVRDIVLGYDTLEEYVSGNSFFGATIGRYSNRISGGTFSIDGKEYHVTQNENGNTLHSGSHGFDRSVWTTESATTHSVTLVHVDPDGNDGFPGAVTARLTVTLIDNSIIFEYAAITDAPTHISLTNHSYFNLNGAGGNDITDHIFSVSSDGYTEVDESNIPTGRIVPVAGTFFDLRNETLLSERLAEYPGRDFDINYVLQRTVRPTNACSAHSRETGIRMTLSTTEPGVQFYSGAYINGVSGKSGSVYGKHAGFCFEPQHYPDTPNRPSFPSTLIRPNEHYSQKSVLEFSTV
ncbi:MAG: aldose epimerase family protein [Spirochaetota bacterium]